MKKYQIIYKIKIHFKRGLTPLLCALTIFNFCGISAHAYGMYEVELNISEPYVSDNQGYFVVYDSAGRAYTYIWTFTNYVADVDNLNGSPLDPYENTNSIRFLVSDVFEGFNLEYTSSMYSYFTLYQHSSATNQFKVYFNDFIGANDLNTWQTYSIDWGSVDTLVAVNLKGKYDYINLRDIQNNTLNVRWGNEFDLNSIINSLNTMILNQEQLISLNTSINTNLSDIKNSLIQGDSNGSISDVSKNDISNVTNKESQILNTSNIDTSALNVQLNSNVLASTMSLVDSLVTSNPKIASMAFTLMTLAVVAFVLRR